VWPANQPTVTNMTLHHKKIGDQCWEVMRKARSWICVDSKMDCYTIWALKTICNNHGKDSSTLWENQFEVSMTCWGPGHSPHSCCWHETRAQLPLSWYGLCNRVSWREFGFPGVGCDVHFILYSATADILLSGVNVPQASFNSLVSIFWPIFPLHSWPPSKQKLYMPRVFSLLQRAKEDRDLTGQQANTFNIASWRN